ncbi:YtxH domain-containing protein [Niallia endozanthoxylica]|uniref:YtxH domain-containing protein n=1 Tax=Niallia endozanthoxylica TaxID=2036016 RepID=A0A5J5I655_9BACI|nr:YtxH domain-containing protein [Niallia endozanthoxylica]KAA9031187.1 YtxH domain-containing protein [Niallia endozanthoxylica]
MSSSKFWKGVIIGAVAGGVISLLDRATRDSVLENCHKVTGKVSHYVKHPGEVVEYVKESTGKIRSTIEEVGEEVSFIAEKIEELREITPQVVDVVMDTKEAFVDKENDLERER